MPSLYLLESRTCISMNFEISIARIYKISFLLAPVLLIIGALFDGVVKDDIFLQGVFGQYGGMFLIAANIAIAHLIARKKNNLGLISLIAGFIGAYATAAGHMSYFTLDIASELAEFDARALLLQLSENPVPKMMVGGWVGLFMPLSLVLNGIFLLWSKLGPKWAAACLLLAGPLFLLGQGVFALSVLLSPALILFAFLGLYQQLETHT